MDDLFPPNLHQLGEDRGHGNLLGFAPYMIPQDYASKESFYKKLDGYLSVAKREAWLSEKTITVFPEHIGTWLVLSGENETIFHAASMAAAEQTMVLRHPLKFIKYFLKSTEKSRAKAAFFRMKAQQMAEIYQAVFSQLAREYAITIVAGSIVLPASQIFHGEFILKEGTLHNTSLVFQPNGNLHSNAICKAFPTAQELVFTTPAVAQDIPSFDTPAGKLGVLICADSWFPQAYIPLKKQNVDLLAVPSFAAFGTEGWNQPWAGYDGWQPPPDVNPKDIKHLTEGQAWKKYALAGRIRSNDARYGLNVFLRGQLWDQDLGGWPATLVKDDEVFVEEQTRKAALLNLWL